MFYHVVVEQQWLYLWLYFTRSTVANALLPFGCHMLNV